MNETEINVLAAKIVKVIIEDIEDRKGIGDEFGSYDKELKKEIRSELTAKIFAAIVAHYKTN